MFGGQIFRQLEEQPGITLRRCPHLRPGLAHRLNIAGKARSILVPNFQKSQRQILAIQCGEPRRRYHPETWKQVRAERQGVLNKRQGIPNVVQCKILQGLMLREIAPRQWRDCRSEEHTSELQSLMRISYAVFCLKKKNNTTIEEENTQTS